MVTENVSILKIYKLTQEQYDAALVAGNLDENALYLTPKTGGTLTIANVDGLQSALNAKAPSYLYGTTDLVAGTSALETGRLYFVYEDSTSSDSGGSTVVTGIFYVGDVAYTTKQGMTWTEWVDSSYNSGEFTIVNSNVMFNTYHYVTTENDVDLVSTQDEIVIGATYSYVS